MWFVLVLVMKRGVGSVTLSMDADKNVSVTGVDGKAAISNASGSYKIEGDYEYVADVTKRAPQFDLEYTYEKAGKYYHVVENWFYVRIRFMICALRHGDE